MPKNLGAKNIRNLLTVTILKGFRKKHTVREKRKKSEFNL